jgi:hypothetical protein
MDAVFFFGLTAVVLRCSRRRRCHCQSVSSLSNSKFPPDFRFSLSLSLVSHLASHLPSRSLWQKCMQQTISLHHHCNFTIFRKPLPVLCLCVSVCVSLLSSSSSSRTSFRSIIDKLTLALSRYVRYPVSVSCSLIMWLHFTRFSSWMHGRIDFESISTSHDSVGFCCCCRGPWEIRLNECNKLTLHSFLRHWISLNFVPCKKRKERERFGSGCIASQAHGYFPACMFLRA